MKTMYKLKIKDLNMKYKIIIFFVDLIINYKKKKNRMIKFKKNIVLTLKMSKFNNSTKFIFSFNID